MMAKDTAQTIRNAGLGIREAMPVEAIEQFLRRHSGADAIEILELDTPQDTGYSSGAVFFTARIGSGCPQRLFLKHDTRAPVRPFHHYDLAAQFTVQKVLFQDGIPVPEPLYVDADGTDLGRPGYVMRVKEGKPGSSKAWLEGALAAATPEIRDAMLQDAIIQMVRMHAIDHTRPELACLCHRAAGKNSIEREINWIVDLSAHHEFYDPRIDAAVQALRCRMPEYWMDCFNHGDNKFDNYLFDGRKVAAVIDFEMCTVAPREMDLAYLLFTTNILTPKNSARPVWFPDAPRLIGAYEAAGGKTIRNFDYYEDLIALKFSVMVLAYTSRLGLTAKMPEMFSVYWRAIESIAR